MCVCVCVCVCVCLRPLLLCRGPIPGCVPWALCASLPTPTFPSGNGRSVLSSEPRPPVSSPFCYPLAASSHLICPQATSRVPLTFACYILSAPFAQAPLGWSPTLQLRGGGDKGNLIWAPPPRSPCASPTTSWKRRGPREGASPTSLLSSMHCWNGLRG